MGPQGINNRGQIVGFYDLNNNPNGDRHGFVYQQGQFRTIDITLPGAQLTVPQAINDHGDIAGIYVDNRGVHGFVLDGDIITIIDFPLPGVIRTEIWGINNAGKIVGKYIDAAGTHHGFLATEKH